MRQTFCSGPSRNTAAARASLLRSWTRMTGSRLLASSPAETIPSASTSSTKIRSQLSRKVTGSKERTRSLSSSFAKTEPSSGLRSQISSMLAWVSPGTASSAESAGSTSLILRLKKTRSVLEKISLFWRKGCLLVTSGLRLSRRCLEEQRTTLKTGSTWCIRTSRTTS